jgi:hypothetical protein
MLFFALTCFQDCKKIQSNELTDRHPTTPTTIIFPPKKRKKKRRKKRYAYLKVRRAAAVKVFCQNTTRPTGCVEIVTKTRRA